MLAPTAPMPLELVRGARVWQGLSAFLGVFGLLCVVIPAYLMVSPPHYANEGQFGSGFEVLFYLWFLFIGGPIALIASATLLNGSRKVLTGKSYRAALKAAKHAPSNAGAGIVGLLPLFIVFVPIAVALYVVARIPLKYLTSPSAPSWFSEP